MTESPRFIAADDPEWCAGCGRKHSKCLCITDHPYRPDGGGGSYTGRCDKCGEPKAAHVDPVTDHIAAHVKKMWQPTPHVCQMCERPLGEHWWWCVNPTHDEIAELAFNVLNVCRAEGITDPLRQAHAIAVAIELAAADATTADRKGEA